MVPPEIAATALGEEIFFLEVRQAERRKPDFAGGFGQMRAALAQGKVHVLEVWAGETRLYLKVTMPAGTVAERNSIVDRLQSLPLVAQVISSQAAPSVLRDVHRLQKFDSRAAIPDARLRGFREKRRDFKPDLNALHTGEIIIKYLEAETDTPARLAATKARVVTIHGRTGARVVKSFETARGPAELLALGSGVSFAAALQSYLDSEDVEFAQPNYVCQASRTPNDQYYPLLWGMTKISAPAAWDVFTDASSVIVAVTDTGIDYAHPDLSANMWQNPNIGALGAHDGLYGADFISYDSDPMDDQTGTYHGTHVAGTIGARGNNVIGVVGVAWQTKLMAVKVLGSSGSGTAQSFAAGLDYARLKGAQIVNASLGWGSGYNPGPIVEIAIEALNDAGVVFVNAAGNSTVNCDVTPTYPGSYGKPNMVVVNSSNISDGSSYFSNYGRWSTDVFAPGGGSSILAERIYSTRRGNQYAYLEGTSMASPNVAGMLALAKAQFPSETANELADRARLSVDSIGGLQSLSMAGGRINAASALGPRPRFFNLSTRCQVNTGYEVAIGGIVVTGPEPKRIAFRGIGPTLTGWGVPGALADPQIRIYTSAGQQIGYNDDWSTLPPADRDELIAFGIAPADSSESAWIATLAPGCYGVHLSGVEGATGIGMVESWDIDGSTANRMFNLSTRCYVGTGTGVAVGGLIVRGNKPRQVYIRAWGPSLGNPPFNVPGALQDPMITLFNSSGSPIASNDDWQTFDGTSTALENRLTQTGYPPFDPRDSAIVMRLNPGNYSVHLSGKNGATGIGMIEINEY